MRTTFIRTLCEMAEKDKRIWLLCGDLGFSVLEVFAEKFPDRYINVGVAEQNMTGIAAGLALSGKTVFTYSIANFPVMRCLEQIRNDVCYHNLSVKIVAVGGGYAYGSQGYTHHGVEDFAVTCAMPNMTVLAPGDPVETALMTRAIASQPGPCYLRLGKANEPVIHQSEPNFEIGKALTLREGKDMTLISTGGMLDSVVKASDLLESQGYSVEVLSMPTIRPIDNTAIVKSAERTGRIITVEEHGWGGLGTVVAETMAQSGVSAKFVPLRLGREVVTTAGSQDILRAEQGLSVEGIAKAAVETL